jgi:quinol-cytochrome oxidoreductase complex cytochrome b subunit
MEDLFRKNPKLWMVSIYLFMVAGFLFIKPSVAFGPNGEIKPFGTKKKGSTIFPVWWWMFVFAALSYIAVAVLTKFKM